MGIMNKMKTVALKDLGTWQYDNSSLTPFFFVRGSNAKPLTQFISVKGYTQKDGFWRQAGNDLCVGVGSDSVAISNLQFTTVSAFLASEGDKILTYETADSVEEEIVSYHPQQLVRNGNFEGQTYWYVYSGTGTVSNNELTVTGAVGRGGVVLSDSSYYYPLINGHKYFVNIEYKTTVRLQTYTVKSIYLEPSDQWVKHQEIVTRTSGVGNNSDIFPERSGEVGTFSLRNIMVVDLTALYGAGNEPYSVATFLSQHPEYNSYVPYYDGPINIEEEITEYNPLKPVMADNKWTDIFNAFKNGKAPDTWQVGDTKPLTLLDGTTYTIRLCDKQAGRYQYSDGSGSSKAVFEFVELVKLGSTTTFQMNTVNTNEGGWASSYLRATTIPNFETFLPDDVLAAISEVNVLSGTGNRTSSGTSSSANKLFLPAEMEMFSSRTYSIGNAECPLGQFDYYKAHNANADRIKRYVGTTTAYYHWLRSPLSGNSGTFCVVSYNGSADFYLASNSVGLFPIFAI